MKAQTMTGKKHIAIIIIFLLFILLTAGIFFFLILYTHSENTVTIEHLRICHLKNPIGIDEETPSFSWQMKGDRRGISQSAYRIMLADSPENLMYGNFLWDSGKISASTSAGIPYEGSVLIPMSRYYWQVTVWDEKDKPFSSAEEAFFETGLMGEDMPGAKWISAPENITASVYSEKEPVYSISYNMEVANTSAGFIFGADGGRYGDMYLCSIRSNDEQAFFALQKVQSGSIEDTAAPGTEIDITDCRMENNPSLFSVDLQIDHETLLVTINNKAAGSYSIDSKPAAAIGYYKSRGTSYAYLDNLLVQDASGHVLYQEDFDAEENIFAPYYTATEEGRLKIGSGMILTKYHENPAPFFYREFSLQDEEIKDARIYMTALGSFALTCNGHPVSDEYFAPGKLAYNRELTYVTYDVTSLLQQGGSNALGIILLHGWYDRAAGYPETWNPWGSKNALLGMLRITYQNGATQTIVTDENFFCSPDGPIREDDIYQGEFYDASLEWEGFGDTGFSCEGWSMAETDLIDTAYFSLPLKGKANEPIRCVERLSPLSVSEPLENVFVYDFGQNFAGTCSIQITGDAGQILTLRYGEALNTENMDNCDDVAGTIWSENLLTAEATDYYVLKGNPEGESFEPKYTYHGFRYLQITGLDNPLPLEDVTGIVLSSDLKQTGSFESSNELLNRFYQNTLWSQRSNFMDNPTDCPQRDERHGWAGDAQIYSLAASYHMDTYAFYRKYLHDLMLLQTDGGSFPDMAPRNFDTGWGGRGGSGANNCWGDAAVIITWNLYTQYGDLAVIEENYDALCRWMEVLTSTSNDYIRTWGGYGDHLSLEDTPSDVSDTAWCAHSADLLSKMAAILDKPDEAAYYQQIFENYKTAWQNAYVQPDGITTCDTQTSYALGLAFDLFSEEQKEAAADRLKTLAVYSGYHIHTGFSGIGCLLPALSRYNLTDTAYAFLLQEEYPSLLYPVKYGATTVYEQLSAYTISEEGTCHLDGSLNHYAFGTPVSFLYTNILGIKSDEKDPGYHHILLEPDTAGGFTYAKGGYESVYGSIQMEWEQTDGGYRFCVEIPANTTALLKLPIPAGGNSYLENGKSIERASGVEYLGQDGDKLAFELASGYYCFSPK